MTPVVTLSLVVLCANGIFAIVNILIWIFGKHSLPLYAAIMNGTVAYLLYTMYPVEYAAYIETFLN